MTPSIPSITIPTIPPNLLLILAVLLLFFGVIEVITGETRMNIAPRNEPPRYIIYYGTTLGWLKIVGAVVFAITALVISKFSVRKDLAGIVLIGGFVLGVILSAFFQFSGGSSKPSAPKTLNIHQAAKYLRISEQEVIDLVESGRLEAHKNDGQYHFDKEILALYAGK